MRKSGVIIAVLVIGYLSYLFYVKHYLDITLETPVTIAMGDRDEFLITQKVATAYLRSAEYDANQWNNQFRMPVFSFTLANYDKKSPGINYRIFEIADILLQRGANINATDGNGFTAMHDAIKHANIEVINYLVSRGASLEQGIYAPGQPANELEPLAYAMYLQHQTGVDLDYQVIIQLLKKYSH